MPSQLIKIITHFKRFFLSVIGYLQLTRNQCRVHFLAVFVLAVPSLLTFLQ